MLEKKFKSGPQYSQKEVVELAISVLQVRRRQEEKGGVSTVEEKGGASAVVGLRSCTALPTYCCSRSAALNQPALAFQPIPLSCAAAQHVLGEDLKASDIEVGLASAADGGRFRVLSSEELDEHLIAISERD